MIPKSGLKRKNSYIIILLLIGMLLMSICGATACYYFSPVETTTESIQKQEIELTVKSEWNLLLAKYNIVIEVDGQTVGTLSNGETGMYKLMLEHGDHTLSFRSEDNRSVDGSQAFTIEKSSQSITSYIISHMAYIEIKDLTVLGDELTSESLVADSSDNSNAQSESEEPTLPSVEETDPPTTAEKRDAYYVTINVDCWKNSIFSTYNLDIYFDTNYLGTVRHGEKGTITIKTKPGAYNLKITKEHQQSLCNSKTITVDSDLTINCSTNCYSDGPSTSFEVLQVEYEKKQSNTSTIASLVPTTKAPTTERPVSLITKDNNPDFAALYTASFVDAEAQAAFIKKYKGKTVQFDCVVLGIFQHKNSTIDFDYILAPGEDKDHIGATIFFLDGVNKVTFHWDSATRPEYLEFGSKITLRAEVVTGSDPLYIYLKPIKTWGR